MSLVNYIATEDFILFCGEQRGMDLTNGEIAGEKFIKVHKSKNNVLFGFAGKCQDNYEFCNKYLYNDVTLNSLTDNADYCQVRDYLRNKIKIYELSVNLDKSVACCIGGWDGNKLCISIFHVNKNCDAKIANDEIYSSGMHDIKFGTLILNELHLQNFNKELGKITNYSILQFKNAFKTTVEDGMIVDNTINNHFSFEVLKRKEFI